MKDLEGKRIATEAVGLTTRFLESQGSEGQGGIQLGFNRGEGA